MASFMDISVLNGMSSIFTFILLYVLVYGLLKFTKLFNNSNGVAAVIAFSIAILATMSGGVAAVIKVTIPWFTLMFILTVFILLLVMMFGGFEAGKIAENMGIYHKVVINWIVVISVIIFISGIGVVYFGGDDSPYSLNGGSEISDGSGDFNSSISSDGVGDDEFFKTLFNPKVIGTILFLILGGLTVLLMGSK